MIESQIYIKTLNATDCVQTSSHPTGTNLPSAIMMQMFPAYTYDFNFNAIDCIMGKTWPLRLVTRNNNGQNYITGTQNFYRSPDVNANVGDTLLIEHRKLIDNGSVIQDSYFLNCCRKNNVAVLQKKHNGYLIVRNDSGQSSFTNGMQLLFNNELVSMVFKLKGNFIKQKNSTTLYPHYDVFVNDVDLKQFINVKTDFFQIDFSNKTVLPLKDTDFVTVKQ